MKTILVIDDEEAIILLLETILGVYGYNALTCQDPLEGMDIALNNPPDLIILDVAMPKIDGYEVCLKLKAASRTKHVPILMVTALALEQDKKKGLDAGADGFIFKPFEPETVIAEIEKLTG